MRDRQICSATGTCSISACLILLREYVAVSSPYAQALNHFSGPWKRDNGVREKEVTVLSYQVICLGVTYMGGFVNKIVQSTILVDCTIN